MAKDREDDRSGFLGIPASNPNEERREMLKALDELFQIHAEEIENQDEVNASDFLKEFLAWRAAHHAMFRKLNIHKR